MPKRLLEDMVPVQHHIKDNKKEIIEEMWETKDSGYGSHNKKSHLMLWVVASACVVFLFFVLSFLFSKAEVEITPKTQDVVLNQDLSASKDSSTDDVLPFDLVVIPGEENVTIKASGQKDVATAATGTVVIYNNFSSAPQNLNIDTRLEGSNGKMYKTTIKTTVPGKPNANTPGSVEVPIYANEAGSEYNSAPLDFKIFGFKGTPKYAKFYARSKGEITGGFKGKTPAVSDEDKAVAVANLKSTLQSKLLQKAADQIPSGFVLFKDAVFLNTDDSNISSVATGDSLTMTLKGVLQGILFDEKKLTKEIVTKNVKSYDGSDIYISNIKDLKFSLADKTLTSLNDVKDINFNLSGPAKIVWKVNANKLITDLLGRSKNDFNQVSVQYGSIDSALLKLSPPWIRSLPDSIKDINIIVNYPK